MKSFTSSHVLSIIFLACTNGVLLGLTQELPDKALSIELSQESSPPSPSPIACTSIVALAFTPDPYEDPQRRATVFEPNDENGTNDSINNSGNLFAHTNARSYQQQEEDEGEMFECELPDGLTLPIAATQTQLTLLRESLNDGRLVSSVSTLEGMTVHLDAASVQGITDANVLDSAVVTLPKGPWTFFTPDSSHPLHKTNRQLATYEGLKTVLVVRIIDANGLVNPDPPSVMSDKIFGTYGDQYTMTSQYHACSFGKLTITNDYGVDMSNIESAPGVVEVTTSLDITAVDLRKSTSRNALVKATEAKLGRSLPGVFDHVLFVLEACYVGCGWAGYATVNGWLSVYHKHHYKSMAVTLHEIGHNLNLAHSRGIDGKEYSDHTCLMGNPWFQDDVGQMCFNPAKTFQIANAGAWYNTRYTLTWESGTSAPNLWQGNIIGVADYDNNPQGLPIVVKLETGTDVDYFVGFNRAYGVNVDSKIAKDMVTITQAGNNGVGYNKSLMMAMLSSGQSYGFADWKGSGKILVVTVRSINKNTDPWYAEIQLNFNNAPIPTPPPSNKPTPRPVTPSPTNKPTLQQATPSPSKKPTLQPLTPKPTTSSPTPYPSYQFTNFPATPTPTRECGDNICKPHESDLNCPEDCINIEFATYSTNIGAKGGNGTMFSVKALRDVSITSISTFIRSKGSGLVQIYTRPGSYVGFESSETGWIPIFDNTVLQNGDSVLTHLGPFINNAKVNIAKGLVQSFYVYAPSNLAYRGENLAEGDLVLSDGSLEFYSGIAIANGKFGEGQKYSPRQFSGVLRYNGIILESPPVNCWTIQAVEQCQQAVSCSWNSLYNVCRRSRLAGKTAKRARVV